MYLVVPVKVPARDPMSSPDTPKSQSLTTPCRERRIFEGLMSLWITFFECKYARPCRTCQSDIRSPSVIKTRKRGRRGRAHTPSAKTLATFSPTRPFLRLICSPMAARLLPSQSSITSLISVFDGDMYAPKNRTTFVCLSPERKASSRTSCFKGPSCVMIVLRANRRPVRLSFTASTAPLAPSPSNATTSNMPSDQMGPAPPPTAGSPIPSASLVRTDEEPAAEPGDGSGRVPIRRTSCRRSLRDTIFEIERGVISAVVLRWSSGTPPLAGDCTIGEPGNGLRTGPAASSARLAGASCGRDAGFEFEGNSELPGLTFSVKDGRWPATADLARPSTGAGRDEQIEVERSGISLGDVGIGGEPLWDRCSVRGPAGF